MATTQTGVAAAEKAHAAAVRRVLRAVRPLGHTNEGSMLCGDGYVLSNVRTALGRLDDAEAALRAARRAATRAKGRRS